MEPENSDQTNLVKVGYSIADVCKILGVCRDTVYREINSGKLKTFKVGARRRFVSKIERRHDDYHGSSRSDHQCCSGRRP